MQNYSGQRFSNQRQQGQGASQRGKRFQSGQGRRFAGSQELNLNDELNNQDQIKQLNNAGKTRHGVCKQYLHRKSCNRGNQCPFSHNIEDVNVCILFLKEMCPRGEECENKHDYNDKKKPICQFIITKQMLCKRTDCHFKHVVNRCPNYDLGYCSLGDDCPWIHIKMEVCKNYLYGFCPEGPNCQYKHPKHLFFKGDAENIKSHWNQRLIKCNKCQIIGHKANECDNYVEAINCTVCDYRHGQGKCPKRYEQLGTEQQ